MLSFKQFITEKYDTTTYYGEHVNRASFGHHEVATYFHPHRTFKGSYGVDFTINGDTGRRFAGADNMESHHKMAMLHHVHKTISHFIEKHKPDSLTLAADDPSPHAKNAKKQLYRALADKLASKHNGDAIHSHTDSYVGFKHSVNEDFEPVSDSEGVYKHEHVTRVHDHHVKVSFHHKDVHHVDGRVTGDPKHVSVSYSVNRSMTARNNAHVTPEHKMAIMKHVHNTISKYIDTHKPKTVSMSAFDDDHKVEQQKTKMYHAFTSHLAKKHGGEMRGEYEGQTTPVYKIHLRHPA